MLRTYEIPANRWKNFYHFDELDSTNEEALRFIGKGIRSGIVVADAQTAGRGRGDKAWHSPVGKNLYLTFFSQLAETVVPRNLAKVVAVSLIETAAAFLPAERIRLKWPNDLLIDGKKCAGVLIHFAARGNARYYLAGIGLNLETPDKSAFPWTIEPTSLSEAARRDLEPQEVLPRLLSALDTALARTEEEIDRRYYDAIRWMEGHRIEAENGGQSLTGQIAGFTDGYRQIVVTTDDGQTKEFASVDIARIRVAQGE